jgi:hypothetical protein
MDGFASTTCMHSTICWNGKLKVSLRNLIRVTMSKLSVQYGRRYYGSCIGNHSYQHFIANNSGRRTSDHNANGMPNFGKVTARS